MKLLIVGCGGHGRCCLEIAEAMKKYDEIAFLDDAHVDKIIQGRIVIGKMNELESYGKNFDEVFIAIGNNKFRKELLDNAEKANFKIATLIHPYSCVSHYANIGKGSVIFPNVCIESNTTIGRSCIICANCVINHDTVVKDGCLIYANTTVRANVVIHEYVKIGSNCSISFGKQIEANRVIEDGMLL